MIQTSQSELDDRSAPALVEFRHVSYRIGAQWILRDIDLAAGTGETLVLLGRSGSGKTTLLRMILGLITPTAGEVLVEGKPTTAWDPIRLRRRSGYVIQEVGLFPHFSVEANVGLVPRLEGWAPDAIRARAYELLSRMGLPAGEFAGRFPRQLSGGQKQRVGIARALAADPSLLLLDEPFGALDPVTRLELQRQFLVLRRSLGKTAVFVTHEVREALMMATKIALLDHGRVDVVASPADFRGAQTPEARAFLACLDREGEEDAERGLGK